MHWPMANWRNIVVTQKWLTGNVASAVSHSTPRAKLKSKKHRQKKTRKKPNKNQMSEPAKTLEELSARLSVNPELVKNLVSEIASQITKEYLTIEELAQRLSWQERTVKNKIDAGIFQKGVHYFAPKGIRARFKWSAIVTWLEERDRRDREKPAFEKPEANDRIPMARGYLLGQRGQRKSTAAS
jgi:hypothetical protein